MGTDEDSLGPGGFLAGRLALPLAALLGRLALGRPVPADVLLLLSRLGPPALLLGRRVRAIRAQAALGLEWDAHRRRRCLEVAAGVVVT